LAARTAEGGLVVAADRQTRRLLRLLHNVERVGVKNVVVLACDMSKRAPLLGRFDDVLVDAPCSGTGTLRRHPEIRWRLQPDDLPVHAGRQRRILGAAADLVRPGGRLVYSVCSIEPEEGEAVVAAFVAERPEFTRADPRSGLSIAAGRKVGDDLAVRTSPLDDGMDGFFAVLLTRRAE
jgi:16S rRNA (cytosine967-C5)-methyltransferase